MDDKHGQEVGGHEAVGHETGDANIRPIVLTGVGLAILAAVVCVIIYGIFNYLANHPTTNSLSNPMAPAAPQEPRVPRIEEHPAIELQALRAQEDATLSTYGWADKKTGAVRIPIDRAIELQLQRGFPTRQEPSKSSPKEVKNGQKTAQNEQKTPQIDRKMTEISKKNAQIGTAEAQK